MQRLVFLFESALTSPIFFLPLLPLSGVPLRAAEIRPFEPDAGNADEGSSRAFPFFESTSGTINFCLI